MSPFHAMLTRRGFLQKTCSIGAALAVAGIAQGLLPSGSLAASGQAKTEQQTRLLMGTLVTLTAVSPDPARAQEAFALAFAEIERLIAVFDRHDAGSALGQLNAAGSLASPPKELAHVLGEALALGRSTEFAFNPAITPLVELFERAKASRSGLPGYGNSDFRHALALADPAAIQCKDGRIRLEREGMRLTLDGIAKGYIADMASETLSRKGVRDHMVNAGGDIRVSGRAASGEPWRVGVQHPGKAEGLLTAVPVSGAIATSGSYEKYYDRSRGRHHLISHVTGKSADIASVTVRAATAMQADALATTLAFLPPAQALRYAQERSASCLIVNRQGECFVSSNWG